MCAPAEEVKGELSRLRKGLALFAIAAETTTEFNFILKHFPLDMVTLPY
jgi:hypothetical protein